MQANRSNINAEKPPTLVLLSKELGFEMEVGEIGQFEVNIEIIGQDVNPDDNGNEIMQYTLSVVDIKKINNKDTRIQ